MQPHRDSPSLVACCSLQKGNLQLNPVKARARGFSAGFLCCCLSLSLFSFSGSETNSGSSTSCHLVSMGWGNSPSPSLPRNCRGDFSTQAGPPSASPTSMPQRKGLSAPSCQQLGFLPARFTEQEGRLGSLVPGTACAETSSEPLATP